MNENIQELETQLNQVKSNIAEIDDIMKPYQEKRKGLVDLRKELSEKVDSLKVERILQCSREEQAEYFINSVNCGDCSYKEANKFFNNIGLSIAGFFPSTNQYCLQIAMNRDGSNLDKTNDGIAFMLPFLKNDNGHIQISIMEHTLCEWEIYVLSYDIATKNWSYTTMSRLKYNQTGIFIDSDLKSVLSFICEAGYYQE